MSLENIRLLCIIKICSTRERPRIYLYTSVNNEFVHLGWIDTSTETHNLFRTEVPTIQKQSENNQWTISI